VDEFTNGAKTHYDGRDPMLDEHGNQLCARGMGSRLANELLGGGRIYEASVVPADGSEWTPPPPSCCVQ